MKIKHIREIGNYMNVNRLETDEKIKSFLIKADPKLKKLIDYIGKIKITLSENYFESLVRTIIGQQLSIKAKNAIIKRFINYMNNYIAPEKIINTDDRILREIGISNAKISYIKNLSVAIVNNCLNFNEITNLSDGDVINKLTKIKGIGTWTAEMFLIFSLGRTDVFSLNDVGLQRSINWLYNYNEKITKKDLLVISSKWKPYRTYAALYLWEAINREIIIKDI